MVTYNPFLANELCHLKKWTLFMGIMLSALCVYQRMILLIVLNVIRGKKDQETTNLCPGSGSSSDSPILIQRCWEAQISWRMFGDLRTMLSLEVESYALLCWCRYGNHCGTLKGVLGAQSGFRRIIRVSAPSKSMTTAFDDHTHANGTGKENCASGSVKTW